MPFSGVILRPGFIHGTRTAGSMKIPLGVIGSPLEMVISCASRVVCVDIPSSVQMCK